MHGPVASAADFRINVEKRETLQLWISKNMKAAFFCGRYFEVTYVVGRHLS